MPKRSELKKFLTNFIVEKELLDHDEASDETDSFLDFVKSRTGLLIEAGDDLYSFLHLTFQEYLAATYLLYRGEFDGVPKIWEMIGEQISNPRWHEVIRLLIASLKSEEGQAFFIDQISSGSSLASAENVLLLGGLLLDGIEPAERQSVKIMGNVFFCAYNADKVEDLLSLERLFRSWIAKRHENRGEAWLVFENLGKELGQNAYVEEFADCSNAAGIRHAR
jgi:hypothetical protein